VSGQQPLPDDDAEAAAAGTAGTADSAGSAQDAPLGGDETTQQNLTADNEAEEAMLETLDPDQPPA
jgi:hypothetical protein